MVVVVVKERGGVRCAGIHSLAELVYFVVVIVYQLTRDGRERERES